MNLQNSIVDKISTQKDWSLKIVLITRELPADELAQLFLSLNKEILSIDIPEDNEQEKSPSQRLRSVLYILWEQSQKDKFKTFTLYYNHILEQLINLYKDKLEPNEFIN